MDVLFFCSSNTQNSINDLAGAHFCCQESTHYYCCRRQRLCRYSFHAHQLSIHLRWWWRRWQWRPVAAPKRSVKIISLSNSTILCLFFWLEANFQNFQQNIVFVPKERERKAPLHYYKNFSDGLCKPINLQNSRNEMKWNVVEKCKRKN